MTSLISSNFSEMLKDEKSVSFKTDISCMDDEWMNEWMNKETKK